MLRNILPIIFLMSLCAFSYADDHKDHPLLSRFPGSEVTEYTHKDFLAVNFLIFDDKKNATKLLKEGQFTGLKYLLKQDTSMLAIIKNAQNALQNAGFKILQNNIRNSDLIHGAIQSGMDQIRIGFNSIDIRFESDYLLMCREDAKGTQYVAVIVGDMGENKYEINYLILEESKQIFVPLEVSAKEVSSKLKENGKIELYGIYFDTGKSILKPESKPQLEKISTALKSESSLRLYIVGHTDNVGKFGDNIQLSQDRAKAVMAELINNYGADKTRLDAYGVGSLSPLASNGSENGKAKNRRVELVQQ